MTDRRRRASSRLPRLVWSTPATDHGLRAIERATADDLMELAADVGRTPMQVGAVLVLDTDADFDLPAAVMTFDQRVGGIPRLRQTLVRPPLGCGRPIWIDDQTFDIHHHVTAAPCPRPGTEAALLDVAARELTEPVPMERPPWRARFVTDLEHGRTALIVIFHHVLADGIGGLAMLGQLVDGQPPPTPLREFPRRPPSATELALDAARARGRALARLPRGIHRVGLALRELGSGRAGRAPVTSLNRPTSDRRALALTRTPLEQVHALARRHAATVNDAVLVAVTGALASVLDERGESVDELVVSMPVAGRAQAAGGELGNRVGVMPASLPTRGSPVDRLGRVAAITAAQKAESRGASAVLMVPAMRLLGFLGVLERLIDRQILINTLVTNLRGPDARLAFAGAAITDVIPLTPTTGNVTAAFAVLSYAGTLGITVVTDPTAGLSGDELARRLEREIERLVEVD